MNFSASSPILYYFAVVTLLDQLNPKEYNWQRVSVLLQGPLPNAPSKLPYLFGGMKTNITLSRIVSELFMDPKRAGLFWVNSQTYADLARYILEFLRDT